jgi:DNA-binding transcriptional ArsR family regulator
MAKYSPGSLDAVFAALADPTRRAMAERLRRGEASVSELAEPFGFALPTVSRHLKALEHAGLVQHRKVGRVRRVRLAPEALVPVDEWLARYRIFWGEQFASLGDYIAGGG